MRIGLDTNLLLRSIQSAHPMRRTAEDSIACLRIAAHELCIFPQNLYEYWAVSTRPLDANGLGKSVSETRCVVDGFQQAFTLLGDVPTILTEWLDLVTIYSVLGKKTHDARIAAAMNVHGITHLLTFNVADFQRFPAIVPLDPHAVASGTLP